MPRRVVIAEDEAIIRLDLKEILESEGYEVVGEASNGSDAVLLVERERPDLAIVDIKMPGLDGIEAARRISRSSQVPVVVLTAFSQRNLIEEARDAGVVSYLVKPFERNELIPAIEVALARFEELQAIEEEERLFAQGSDPQHLTNQPGKTPALEDKLETRRIIDRAKGVLMDRHRMSEKDAFGFIRRTAMDRRTRMREVAAQVLEGTLAPPG